MKKDCYRDSEVGTVVEILHDRLYFAVLTDDYIDVVESCEQDSDITSKAFYFSVDDEFAYEGYYFDFGPLNLSCAYKYCAKVNDYVSFKAKGTEIIHYTSADPRVCVNAAFLMGFYAVVYLERQAIDVYYTLVSGGPFV